MMNSFKDLSILYIDDEPCMHKNVVEYLGYYCDHVYEAQDGVEGFALYEQIHPDITMPKMNALKMVEKIRAVDQETKMLF